MTDFLLASESKRRIDLLLLSGYSFKSYKHGFNEKVVKALPDDLIENAEQKALSNHTDKFCLAADTVVHIADEVFGKAENIEIASSMLKKLLKGHKVSSSYALARNGKILASGTSISKIVYGNVSEKELNAYLASSDWTGKAGALSIQGQPGNWVSEIQGSYTNILGLPMNEIREILSANGIRANK